jgi:hypothetical protein
MTDADAEFPAQVYAVACATPPHARQSVPHAAAVSHASQAVPSAVFR